LTYLEIPFQRKQLHSFSSVVVGHKKVVVGICLVVDRIVAAAVVGIDLAVDRTDQIEIHLADQTDQIEILLVGIQIAAEVDIAQIDILDLDRIVAVDPGIYLVGQIVAVQIVEVDTVAVV
jgi:hypothetical protein